MIQLVPPEPKGHQPSPPLSNSTLSMFICQHAPKASTQKKLTKHLDNSAPEPPKESQRKNYSG